MPVASVVPAGVALSEDVSPVAGAPELPAALGGVLPDTAGSVLVAAGSEAEAAGSLAPGAVILEDELAAPACGSAVGVAGVVAVFSGGVEGAGADCIVLVVGEVSDSIAPWLVSSF